MDALLRGDFSLETRPMLSVHTENGICCLAMNDAAVSRGGYGRLIDLHVLVDDEPVGAYRADGLVVATPTGSTGYSLSAGGPIVAPGVDCMIITPVCAHSLQHRPVVISGSATVELVLMTDEEMAALLQVDGQTVGTLRAGQRVTIRRDEKVVRLIRLKPLRFFDIVRQKLMEWSR